MSTCWCIVGLYYFNTIQYNIFMYISYTVVDQMCVYGVQTEIYTVHTCGVVLLMWTLNYHYGLGGGRGDFLVQCVWYCLVTTDLVSCAFCCVVYVFVYVFAHRDPYAQTYA